MERRTEHCNLREQPSLAVCSSLLWQMKSNLGPCFTQTVFGLIWRKSCDQVIKMCNTDPIQSHWVKRFSQVHNHTYFGWVDQIRKCLHIDRSLKANKISAVWIAGLPSFFLVWPSGAKSFTPPPGVRSDLVLYLTVEFSTAAFLDCPSLFAAQSKICHSTLAVPDLTLAPPPSSRTTWQAESWCPTSARDFTKCPLWGAKVKSLLEFHKAVSKCLRLRSVQKLPDKFAFGSKRPLSRRGSLPVAIFLPMYSATFSDETKTLWKSKSHRDNPIRLRMSVIFEEQLSLQCSFLKKCTQNATDGDLVSATTTLMSRYLGQKQLVWVQVSKFSRRSTLSHTWCHRWKILRNELGDISEPSSQRTLQHHWQCLWQGMVCTVNPTVRTSEAFEEQDHPQWTLSPSRHLCTDKSIFFFFFQSGAYHHHSIQICPRESLNGDEQSFTDHTQFVWAQVFKCIWGGGIHNDNGENSNNRDGKVTHTDRRTA